MEAIRKRWLKNLFAIGIIVFLIYIVDVRSLWAALSQLTWEIAAILGLLSVLLVYLSALKWQIFIHSFGRRASIVRLFNLYLIGYFVNLVIPSYVGGDVVRSWYIGKRVGQHEAAAATILERYTGFVAMLSLALIFMWFVDLVSLEVKIAIVLISLGLATITAIALSEKLFHLLERFAFLESILVHVRKIQEGFHLAKKDKWLLVRALILSFIFHTFVVVNTAFCAFAVGWYHPPLGELFLVVPLILTIGAIPVAPMGLGIQEGAFLYFLSGIGATPAQALGVGVVLRAKAYILAIIGGLIWLCIRRDLGGEGLTTAASGEAASMGA